MSKLLCPPLKPIIFLVCLWPLLSIGYSIYTDNLGANPIEYIEKHFGLWALIFLCVTLSLTPLKKNYSFWEMDFISSYAWLIRLFLCLYSPTYVSRFGLSICMA